MPSRTGIRWYADDLTVGETHDLGSWTLGAEEIAAFGTAWDPLPIHTDARAAAASPFGGLIASGVHSMAVLQRLAVLGFYRHTAVIAGKGFSDLRLPRPVPAGTTVRGALTVTARDAHRPGRSLVRTLATLRGADDELHLEVTGLVVVGLRPGGEQDAPAGGGPRDTIGPDPEDIG